MPILPPSGPRSPPRSLAGGPTAGSTRPTCSSEAEPELGDVAIAIVNDLAALGEPVVIVIDDFHFASAAAPSLTTFIERLPSSCRVIIGSRTEPQLALYRLRAHGQLLEVRDAELRLTQAEVAAVMLEFGIELNETDVELLTARTEGWTAGVQMAAVSLRDESLPDLFLTEFAKTPRSITDFLGTEVLERQPAEILDFLLATSILDALDPRELRGRDRPPRRRRVAPPRRRPAPLPHRVGPRYLPVPPSVR